MKKTGLAAVAALAAVAVAGCGGGSDSNKTLSYSDFTKQAEQICKDNDTKVAAVGKLTGSVQTDAPLFPKLLPIIKSGQDDFKKLKPPAQLQADFDKFNSIGDQQYANAQKALVALKAGDQNGYIAVIKQTQGLSQQSKIEGSKLGAPSCAK